MRNVAGPLLWIWNHTLSSVWFGISTMVLIALYVAVGSGFTSIAKSLEMDEMALFNAWPMMVLAALLVANLVVVTIDRIPFTPPRYGVWCVHSGIIVLVFGMVFYFKHKTEGMTLIQVGETVNWYYDSSERALYMKVGRRKAEPIPLPRLPRYNAYAAEHGNERALARRGLHGIVPTLRDYDPELRAAREKPLHELLGLEGDEPILVDILAYYPYAYPGYAYQLGDPAMGAPERTGIRMVTRDPQTGERARSRWLVAGDVGQDEISITTLQFRHLHRDDGVTGEALMTAVQQTHELSWQVRGEQGQLTLQPGERAPLGASGYEVEVVEFLPAFPMFGGGEPVHTLEVLVHPPADAPHGRTFRRYLLDGRELQTDFVLDVPGAGPKGQRQQDPVDTDLKIHYALADGLRLWPRGETERHTILTRPDTDGYWRLVTFADAPAQLNYIQSGTETLEIDGVLQRPGEPARPYRMELDLHRHDHVLRTEWLQEVAPDQRDTNTARAGAQQAIKLRVSRGQWQEIIHVPFAMWPDQQAWMLGQVDVPGASEPLQFQLGHTRHDMPVIVTLDRFELVPYAGDFTSQSMMRDFRSHLTIEDAAGNQWQDVARLNAPVFVRKDYAPPFGYILPAESWLLFQNQWDPNEQAFTVLGVGNRPGVRIMVGGCVMIVAGLLWAFYVKPLLIRRNKLRALAAHEAQRAASAAMADRGNQLEAPA